MNDAVAALMQAFLPACCADSLPLFVYLSASLADFFLFAQSIPAAAVASVPPPVFTTLSQFYYPGWGFICKLSGGISPIQIKCPIPQCGHKVMWFSVSASSSLSSVGFGCCSKLRMSLIDVFLKRLDRKP